MEAGVISVSASVLPSPIKQRTQELLGGTGRSILCRPIANPLVAGTFEVQTLLRRNFVMSDSDDPFTIQQLTELALMHAENAVNVE